MNPAATNLWRLLNQWSLFPSRLESGHRAVETVFVWEIIEQDSKIVADSWKVTIQDLS